MAAGRPRRPNDPSVMSSLESAVREIRRPGPLESCWNWRWELGILATTAGLSGLIAASLGLIGLAAAAGAGLAAISALVCWPPARRWIAAQAWCIITPHRIRVGCINAWVQTRRGRLPIILYTVPTGHGERAQLWCRAGITAADLFAAREVLAAACWATQVRVIPSVQHAHLVMLEVIRNPYPERTRPTAQGWPYSRHVESEAAGDPEEPARAGAWGDHRAVRDDRLLATSGHVEADGLGRPGSLPERAGGGNHRLVQDDRLWSLKPWFPLRARAGGPSGRGAERRR
jgi:hypothetical protein